MADSITYGEDNEQNLPIGGVIPFMYVEGITEVPDNFIMLDGSTVDDSRSDYFDGYTVPTTDGLALISVNPDGDYVGEEVGSDYVNVSLTSSHLPEDLIIYGSTDSDMYSTQSLNLQLSDEYIRTYSCNSVNQQTVLGYTTSYDGLDESWSYESADRDTDDYDNYIFWFSGTKYRGTYSHSHTIDAEHTHTISMSDYTHEETLTHTKSLGSSSGVDIYSTDQLRADVVFIMRIW